MFPWNNLCYWLSASKRKSSTILFTRQAQAFCLKHMVASLPDLSTVYNAPNLANILMKMLSSIPHSHLSEHKIHTIKEIVHTKLFSRQVHSHLLIRSG